MKIEFQNSIRFSFKTQLEDFFEPSTGHKNSLDKFLVNDEMNFVESKYQAF